MQRLIAQRHTLGLTRRAAANLAGIRESTLTRWEKNENSPTLDVLTRYAETLGYEIAAVPRGANVHPIVRQLQRVRLRRCISQATAAAVAHIGKATLEQWELGYISRPKRKTLLRYAAALGYTIDFEADMLVPITPPEMQQCRTR